MRHRRELLARLFACEDAPFCLSALTPVSFPLPIVLYRWSSWLSLGRRDGTTRGGRAGVPGNQALRDFHDRQGHPAVPRAVDAGHHGDAQGAQVRTYIRFVVSGALRVGRQGGRGGGREEEGRRFVNSCFRHPKKLCCCSSPPEFSRQFCFFITSLRALSAFDVCDTYVQQ